MPPVMSNKEEQFQLSIGAKNVEAKFYGKVAIVYVEGPDDICFWRQFFDKRQFEIRAKEGCENLESIINSIINKGLRQIVACDSDYTYYEKSQISHPLVIKTISHSIECIMYCPKSLNACIQRLARNDDDYEQLINDIYDKFCDDIKELIVYDIVNNIYSHGDSVLGDSCARFLKSNKSVCVDKEKVCIYLKSKSFPLEQIEEVRQLMALDERHLRQIAKGHFQTSFIINLLKKVASDVTGNSCGAISGDALYAMLVNCPISCNGNCREIASIKNKIERAVRYLKSKGVYSCISRS